jgi:hypothetical protein
MKRYPFEGKSMSKISLIARQERCFYILGTLYKLSTVWFGSDDTRHKNYAQHAQMYYEGLGVNGPIISVLIGNWAMIGELVTDKLTGRNLIYISANTGVILRLRMNVPRSTWNQAVQLAAFKWISERRSA